MNQQKGVLNGLKRWKMSEEVKFKCLKCGHYASEEEHDTFLNEEIVSHIAYCNQCGHKHQKTYKLIEVVDYE